ncbi:hypothetical protein EVAR_62951_1 [Eumeta japonica]|uniref:Uncharacterized protein n=1 Tax=Eumeta variegata TaxID=151549 RepID=A0A4C1SX93_EUMVA|nr:hypothetical protein EVAR_62951_1 [Eumeta japonica]
MTLSVDRSNAFTVKHAENRIVSPYVYRRAVDFSKLITLGPVLRGLGEGSKLIAWPPFRSTMPSPQLIFTDYRLYDCVCLPLGPLKPCAARPRQSPLLPCNK